MPPYVINFDSVCEQMAGTIERHQVDDRTINDTHGERGKPTRFTKNGLSLVVGHFQEKCRRCNAETDNSMWGDLDLVMELVCQTLEPAFDFIVQYFLTGTGFV